MKSLATKIRNEADEDGDFEGFAELEDPVAFYSNTLCFIRSMTS